MAIATQITIGTGSKISANYQSQDFSVMLTYDVERADTDLQALALEKAEEVESLHCLIKGRVMGLRADEKAEKALATEEKPRRGRAVKTTPATETVVTTPVTTAEVPAPSVPVPVVAAEQSESAAMVTATEAETPPLVAETVETPQAKPPLELPITGPQRYAIEALRMRLVWDVDKLSRLVHARFGTPELDKISHRQAGVLLTEMQRRVATASAAKTKPAPNGVPAPQGDEQNGNQIPARRSPAFSGANGHTAA